MNKKTTSSGFTLVELLVVIAIIGILASIVLPRVTEAIFKGQVAKTVSEIKNIETACAAILSDTGRSNFLDLLNDVERANIKASLDAIATGNDLPTIMFEVDALELYFDTMFYEILRQGKNSDWAINNLKPELRQKLGNSYMELGTDAWGQPYKFWVGPIRRGSMYFRSYRQKEAGDPGFLEYDDAVFDEINVYRYDIDAKAKLDLVIPGSPRAEYEMDGPDEVSKNSIDNGGNPVEWYGFPASKDLAVYVYSYGYNQIDDANLFIQISNLQNDYPLYGGGDDINNWDGEGGWASAPRQ